MGGFQSFDSIQAANTFGSDQCWSIALDIDASVRVVLLGAVSPDTGLGLREEFWYGWIPDAIAAPSTFFSALVQDSNFVPSDLLPTPTLKPLILEPAGVRFGIRLPRNKPYLAYYWSGGGEAPSTLYMTRMSPPAMPSPPVI